VEAFDQTEYIKEQNLIRKQMVQSPTFDQTRRRRLAHTFAPIVASKGITVPENVLIKNCFLIKERALVSEFWELSDFFFVAPLSTMLKRLKTGKRKPALMQELIVVVDEITDFTSMNIEIIVKDWMTKNEIEWEVMQPFRLSLVGALKPSPI
jgi:glutamyl-tRNA synthetase